MVESAPNQSLLPSVRIRVGRDIENTPQWIHEHAPSFVGIEVPWARIREEYRLTELQEISRNTDRHVTICETDQDRYAVPRSYQQLVAAVNRLEPDAVITERGYVYPNVEDESACEGGLDAGLLHWVRARELLDQVALIPMVHPHRQEQFPLIKRFCRNHDVNDVAIYGVMHGGTQHFTACLRGLDGLNIHIVGWLNGLIAELAPRPASVSGIWRSSTDQDDQAVDRLRRRCHELRDRLGSNDQQTHSDFR